MRKVVGLLVLMLVAGAAWADARLTLNTGVGHFPYSSVDTNNEFKRNVDVNIVQTDGGNSANGQAYFAEDIRSSSFLPDEFGQGYSTTVVTGDSSGAQCVMTTDNTTYRTNDWTVKVKRVWGKLEGLIVCHDGTPDE